MEKILNSLKELGLTEYESKIYATLLQNNPINGNVIANLSGVPGPKVYETLRKMNNQGLVFTVSGEGHGRQKHYYPFPYKELLRSKKEAFMDNYKFLNDSFKSMSSKIETDWTQLFTTEGYLASIEVIKASIMECESNILLSCWKKEFNLLQDSLMQVHSRGVKIVTLIFDEKEIDVPWRNFPHFNEGIALKRHTNELACVLDDKKSILLKSLDESSHSVTASHPVMISTTRNYIRHDIYVNRILEDFYKEMTEHYGKNLELLIGDF